MNRPMPTRIAAHYGTQHVSDHLTLAQASAIVPEMLARLDEPIADSSLVACYLLFRHVRRHLPVCSPATAPTSFSLVTRPSRAYAGPSSTTRWCRRRLRSALSFVAGLLPVSHRYMSLDFKIKRMLSGLREPPPLVESRLDRPVCAP